MSIYNGLDNQLQNLQNQLSQINYLHDQQIEKTQKVKNYQQMFRE